MLKWSVTRKVPQAEAIQSRRLSSDVYINKNHIDVSGKRRRSTVSHRRSTPKCSTPKKSDPEINKENCFTSTPIKSLETNNYCEALRDVSNLTPKIRTNKRLREKHTENQTNFFYSHSEKKKKKKACTNLNRSHSDPFPFSPNRSMDFLHSNYFKQFDLVDSHIEGLPIFKDAFKHATPIKEAALAFSQYAPTLPTFDVEESPCCPTNCKPLLDRKPYLSDVTIQNCDINQKETGDEVSQMGLKSPPKITVSPLVKRLIDLRFSKVSYDGRKKYPKELHNDSSYINDLSLDKIVDAILDTSNELERNNTLQERQNELNETHEENLINIAHEQYISASTSSCDRISFDSGFSSTSAKQTHDVGVDFVCKCSSDKNQDDYYKKWRRKSKEVVCEKTIIDITETFNERCVDRDFITFPSARNLKRTSSENNLDENACTLKRQKCIRRRKTLNEKPVHCKEFNLSSLEDKCHSVSPRDDTFWETIKENNEQVDTSQNQMRRTRRCLMFDTSPTPSLERFLLTPDGKGVMDLEASYKNNAVLLKVLRCRGLNRSGAEGSVNAYVKVALNDKISGTQKKIGLFLRTAVQANSSKPIFNHIFTLPISKQDINKRLHIEVWHRDRISRRSELLGCMSFPVKNIMKKDIGGVFRLLPQSLGRNQNVPVTSQNLAQSFASAICESTEPVVMCDSQITNDEIMSIDEYEADILKTSNPTALNQHQKDADENLFLRYLELDPTEGPDAIPAALQRKATGNRNGRTPFTTTKRLIRPSKSGFGFSVVWTHPPRIERVEKGLPADKAGILPGDYIIFVDKHNVVMMPEIEILNLIRSFGNQITLEIFRKNSSRNGSMLSIRPLPNLSGLPTASCLIQHRPSTIGSVHTASADCSKKRLHLPQVTFSAEVGNGIIV